MVAGSKFAWLGSFLSRLSDLQVRFATCIKFSSLSRPSEQDTEVVPAAFARRADEPCVRETPREQIGALHGVCVRCCRVPPGMWARSRSQREAQCQS